MPRGETKLPRWAILPAAGKLIVQSIRHPNSGKAVVLDRRAKKVSVMSIKDAASDGAHSTHIMETVDS